MFTNFQKPSCLVRSSCSVAIWKQKIAFFKPLENLCKPREKPRLKPHVDLFVTPCFSRKATLHYSVLQECLGKYVKILNFFI
jgi:hypothetical protein